MIATAAAGLATRFAPLGLPPVVVKYGGSMLWALLIYWMVSSILPSTRLLTIAALTSMLTAAIESFKLYHSPALDSFRRTLPGILLLGRLFSVRNILAYWLAIALGVLIDSAIRSTIKESITCI
jgi:hypothetical protein